jgi:succinate-semialdehyde dehydrogenase/glutarate-semialdehyde dehydrogenase
VQRCIYDKFLARFVDAAKALKVGNGFEDGVEIGPLIDDEALANARRLIGDAVEKGARLLCGGEALDCGAGSFLAPAVLADVPEEAACMKEEIFAPIAAVCPFDTEEEAVARANATEYGLAAYAFTRDLSRAWRLAEALEAGTVGINDAVPATSNCPFGGFGASGQGRELGSEGLDAFLETRHVSLWKIDG